MLNGRRFDKLGEFRQPFQDDSASADFDDTEAHKSGEATLGSSRPTSWSTPAARLLSALQGAGFSGLIPKHVQNRQDLSFHDVRTLDARPANAKRHVQADLSRKGEEITLSDGLAVYVAHMSTSSLSTAEGRPNHIVDDDALSKVYTPEYLRLLNEKGYEVEDVTTWSWIVVSKSADQAVKRLSAVSSVLSDAGRTPIPLLWKL